MKPENRSSENAGWLSPLLRMYSKQAIEMLRQRRYREFSQGMYRLTFKLLTHGNKRLRRGIVRLAYHPKLRKNPRLDAKQNHRTVDGVIAQKMAFIFPSPTAPLLTTIVIPCFNYGQFVEEAVNSSLNQTVKSLEVIVVDDGSDDPATLDALNTISSLPRVQVVRQENAGLSRARNTGISLAKGEYVCCLDADDTLESTYAEMAIAIMETDHSVGFAYSWVRLFGDEDRTWYTRDFDINEALDDNHTSVAAFFRRDDWVIVGGYRPELQDGYEDWEFWLRLNALGRRGKVIRTPLMNHRLHGHTMTKEAHSKRQLIMKDMWRLNPGLFKSAKLSAHLINWSEVTPSQNPFEVLQGTEMLSHKDERSHLLLLVPRLDAGGGEVVLLDLLEVLAPNWRITIVTTLADQQIWWPKFAKISTDIVPLLGGIDEVLWPTLLKYLVESRCTDVVLSHGSAFAYQNYAMLKSEYPHLTTIDILHNDLVSGHFRNAVVFSKHIDVHVAISDKVSRSLQENQVSAERIRTIKNGIDMEIEFTPDRYDRNLARNALELSPDIPLLIWVGRLSPEKRPNIFVDIVEKISAQIPITALIVGSGELDDHVDQAISRACSRGVDIRREAHIVREEIGQVYAAANFLVLTSSIEGMPFVMLEAMACGCPVASTDVGEINQLIKQGDTGFLAPASSPMELVDMLKEALISPTCMNSMGRAAREAMLNSSYDRRTMQEAYIRLLTGSIS